MRKLVESLPLQFRVLCKQFLLRVIDLEALSIHADIPRFLGQFASVLIFISLIGALGALMPSDSTSTVTGSSFFWHGEQSLISGMMVVVGLISVISWDSTFPDRRDLLVLAPLPIAPRMILLAKLTASSALLGIAILTLNFATGIIWPLLIGHSSILGFVQSFSAYWFTMVAASLFIFCTILTIQGTTALVLPRRLFLRVSAVLQIAAFGIFLGIYFLVPSLVSTTALMAPKNHWILTWSPTFWFFGLFNQLNGSLPPTFLWLAKRGWIGLSIAVVGAITSLSLCYWQTMKKAVEQPDLVPGARGMRWIFSFAKPLRTAIFHFSIRSLLRSRQHRLACTFYLALIFSTALVWLRIELFSSKYYPLSAEFLVSTFMIMSFAIFGMRSIFSLPISLNANWIWRITQLYPSRSYIASIRGLLLCIAALPAWLLSAFLSLAFQPWYQVIAHLTVLALVGWAFVEISLINFNKVPFTCSYLPGKVHIQILLGCFFLLVFVFALSSAEFELPALHSPTRFFLMLLVLTIVALGIWIFNRYQAHEAILHFDELQPEVITTLGLITPYSETATYITTKSIPLDRKDKT